MSEIRHVVLSDLHFGATNSMLTALRETSDGDGATTFSADPEATSPVLSSLVECLADLTGGQVRPPTLVLAGDVLDLALSPDEVAAAVFGQFARLAFNRPRPVFAPVVHYLPGNHDHHLWETSRETQYVDYVCGLPGDQRLEAPWHTTALSPQAERPVATSPLLRGLFRRQPGAGAVDVHVSYPNLGLRSPDGGRAVVISHGHFTESIYLLMSELRDLLYPGQAAAAPATVEGWEAENFAWIDFFWSTLGRSGQVGTDVGLVYADLSSPAALNTLVDNLVTGLLAKGRSRPWLRTVEREVIEEIVRHEVGHLARSERGTPEIALSAKGRAGVERYLSGPVRRQIVTEWGAVPGDLTFVFGHTHKPFVDRYPLPGFPSPVGIRNSGGWVVDTAAPAPAQAGVAVLISDELDVASVRLYGQGSAAAAPAPGVLDAGGAGEPGPWAAELASWIVTGAEPWRTLRAASAELAAQRHRLQAALTAARTR